MFLLEIRKFLYLKTTRSVPPEECSVKGGLSYSVKAVGDSAFGDWFQKRPFHFFRDLIEIPLSLFHHLSNEFVEIFLDTWTLYIYSTTALTISFAFRPLLWRYSCRSCLLGGGEKAIARPEAAMKVGIAKKILPVGEPVRVGARSVEKPVATDIVVGGTRFRRYRWSPAQLVGRDRVRFCGLFFSVLSLPIPGNRIRPLKVLRKRLPIALINFLRSLPIFPDLSINLVPFLL